MLMKLLFAAAASNTQTIWCKKVIKLLMWKVGLELILLGSLENGLNIASTMHAMFPDFLDVLLQLG